jgi:hypothetical protein
MALVTHTLTTGYKGGSVNISGNARSYESNTPVEIVVDVLAGGNKTITFPGAAIDVSKLICVGFEASKALTMTTNDDGTPDDSYTLAANKPVVWGNDFPAELPCPLTVDVTSIKLVNAGSDTAQFKFSCLMDLD